MASTIARFNDRQVALFNKTSECLNQMFENMCKQMHVSENGDGLDCYLNLRDKYYGSVFVHNHYCSYNELKKIKTEIPHNLFGLNFLELCKQVFSPHEITKDVIPPHAVIGINKQMFAIERYDDTAVPRILSEMSIDAEMYPNLMFVKAITSEVIYFILFSKDAGYERLIPTIANNALISNAQIQSSDPTVFNICCNELVY